jgi:hypothetical protein
MILITLSLLLMTQPSLLLTNIWNFCLTTATANSISTISLYITEMFFLRFLDFFWFCRLQYPLPSVWLILFALVGILCKCDEIFFLCFLDYISLFFSSLISCFCLLWLVFYVLYFTLILFALFAYPIKSAAVAISSNLHLFDTLLSSSICIYSLAWAFCTLLYSFPFSCSLIIIVISNCNTLPPCTFFKYVWKRVKTNPTWI